MCLGPSPGLALVGVWHTQEGTGCAAAKVLSPTSPPSILSMTLRCENPHVTVVGGGGSGAEEADKDLTVGQGPASADWNPEPRGGP